MNGKLFYNITKRKKIHTDFSVFLSLLQKQNNHSGGEFIMTENTQDFKNKFDNIGITNDCLTGRGGFTLISRYLGSINIAKILSSLFHFLKKIIKRRCS